MITFELILPLILKSILDPFVEHQRSMRSRDVRHGLFVSGVVGVLFEEEGAEVDVEVSLFIRLPYDFLTISFLTISFLAISLRLPQSSRIISILTPPSILTHNLNSISFSRLSGHRPTS